MRNIDLIWLKEIDSTNSLAARELLANPDIPQWRVWAAEYQSAGKGQRGNRWGGEPGCNLAFTILLRPHNLPAVKQFALSQVCALGVCNYLERYHNISAEIKWPNDIVLNGKKVCGILTEMSAQFDYINHIVIGIGINVHNREFSEEISHMASSLMLECDGRTFHRAEIIAKTMEHFEHYYEIFMATEDLSALVNEYNSMLVNLHKIVKVLDPKEPFEGKAMGITPRGELVVDTWESRKMVSSGEVSVRGIYGYV